MPSPIAAVGRPAAAPPEATRPPRPEAGDFRDALATALDQPGPGPVSGPATPSARPATVALGRMLAVLGGTTEAAAPPLAPVPEPTTTITPASTPNVASNGASNEGGTAVVEQARNYLGIPYLWGGADPATGFDCSGLVQQVFDDLGVSVPRTSAQQSKVGAPVGSLAEARPGDLLFWASSRPGQSNHIGIYVGDGQMLHAPYTGEVVKVGPVRSAPPTTIRRVPTA